MKEESLTNTLHTRTVCNLTWIYNSPFLQHQSQWPCMRVTAVQNAHFQTRRALVGMILSSTAKYLTRSKS
jgi:hypothetical protein